MPEETNKNYSLNKALNPLKKFLDDPQVVEICINGEGQVFIEKMGDEFLTAHDIPELTTQAINNMATRVAAYSKQAVNASKPLLSASLPNGERFQAIIAPATDRGGVISIRKQVVNNISFDDYKKTGYFDDAKFVTEKTGSPVMEELKILRQQNDAANFLSYAVKNKITMVVSGGTSSGKTTFLNGLLNEVDHRERIISIEDTRELTPPHKNYCSLIASKGGQNQANVTVQDLLEASLRLRPDRILLGELRGKEAFTFLRAVNTGHPGSITTVHADTPEGAIEQITQMVMQSDVALPADYIGKYIRTIIPIIVQSKRINGKRKITDIYFNP